MRIQRLWRRADEIRRAFLSRLHSLHHFRSRGRVSVSLGHHAARDRRLRLLVDDAVSWRAHGRLCLRVEEGSAGMGVANALTAATPESNDPYLGLLREDFQN